MVSPVDSASSVQDAKIAQKSMPQEQGDWRAEWKAHCRKDADQTRSTVDDSEVVQLQERIVNLERAQTVLLEERNEWHEKRRLLQAGAVEIARRNNSLNKECSDLQQKLTARERKFSDMENQLKDATESQMRQKTKNEETVALFRQQLKAKDNDNDALQTEMWTLTNDLRGAQPQILDTVELLDVTNFDAELDALRAIQAHNTKLQVQYNAVVDQNTELIKTKLELATKIDSLEKSLCLYHTSLEKAKERVGELAEEMELYKSNESNPSSVSEQTEGFQTCSINVTPTAAFSTPRSMVKFELSTVQQVSTEPQLPQFSQLTDPELRQRLQDFGNCIADLSSPKMAPFKPRTKPLLSSSPLHANITITINPSSSSWTLFQRAQSAISDSSALTMEGPPVLVKRFVNEMQGLETHHAEQTRLAEQWQRVAATHMEEVEALRMELDCSRKVVPSSALLNSWMRKK